MTKIKNRAVFSIFFIVTLIFAAAAFLFTGKVSARAENRLKLVATSPAVREKGEFSTEIYIDENSGVAGTTFTFAYDARLVTLVREKCVIGNTGAVVNIENESVSVSYASTVSTNSKMDFMTLVFRMKENVKAGVYESWLTLNNCEFFDASFNAIDYEYVPSVLTVSARKIGDVYNDHDDGIVNSKDAIYLLQYLAKMAELDNVSAVCANTFVADNAADGTPKINTKDAIMLLQYLAKMDVEMGVGKWTVKAAPTATEGGLLERQSASGLEIFALPVLNEKDYTYSVLKDETCAAEGLGQYVYLKDGDSFRFEKNIAKNNIHTAVADKAVAPTCTETGLTEGSHCSVCGAVLKAQERVDKTAHTPGEWKLDKEPTCTAEGSEHKDCSVCGEELETRNVDRLGHDYSSSWTIDKEADCTISGSKSHRCVRCGDKCDVTEIAPLGHSYGEWEMTIEPTFAAKGMLVRECSRNSSHKETFTLPVLNKIQYRYMHLSDSSCTENGYDGYIYTENDEEFFIGVTLEKTPHTLTEVKGKAATCTETGLTDGQKCSVCGTITISQATIAALGHDFTTAECSRCKTLEEGYTGIADEIDLLNIESNMTGKYVLISDITLSENWNSLGRNGKKSFRGIFDGNNHAIIGFSFDNVSCGGLFYDNGGTIKNLCLSNLSFKMDCYEDLKNSWPTYGNVVATFGGIAATNNGIISSCRITGKITISTRNYLGLWFDSIRNGTDWRNDFYNSYIFGGITAINKGTVADCTIDADFTYSSANYMGSGYGILGGIEIGGFYLHSNVSVGGIAGVNMSVVKNCLMKGECVLNSNQIASSWNSLKQPRTVNVEFNCKFGSIVGDNRSKVDNSKGTICKINEKHKTEGDTNKASLSITIKNEINSGVIGCNSESGKATNCGIY